MTREEAARVIEDNLSKVRWNTCDCAFSIALDMAIEALRQPERPGRWIPVHEHMWKLDEDGKPDEFAWHNSGFCNGVVCEICGEHICIHCNPDWMNDECDEESYRCSECSCHVKEKTDFCPNCGADMVRGEEE